MQLPVRRRTAAALALAAALLGAAAPVAYGALNERPAQPGPRRHGAPYTETRLLFGTARPDGGPAVTEGQFRSFVDTVVTPRFPRGLSVDAMSGQYRDRHGTIERERSYEVVLLYPTAEAEAADPRIEAVRGAYERRFAQESVARVDERVDADF